MDLILKGFTHINLKDDEIYLLGEFSINLLQIGNYILSGKGMGPCPGPVHTLMSK